MKIKSKLFVILLFTSLLPLLLVSTVFYSFQKKSLEKHVYNHLLSVVSLQQDRLNSIVEQNLERLKLVSSRTQLRIRLKKYLNDGKKEHQSEIIRILDDAKASIKSFRNIAILSIDGKVIASTAKNPFPLSRHFDNKILRRAQTENSADTLLLDTNKNLFVLLTGPLSLNDSLIGVLIIESDVDNLVESVSNSSGLGETGEIVVAQKKENGDALFLFPTRFDSKAALKRIMPKENLECPIINHGGGDHDKGKIGTGMDYRGKSILSTVAYLDLVDWTVLVKVDQAEAFSSITQIRNIIIIVTAVVFFLSIVIALFFSNKITKPIIYLTGVTRKIMNGELLHPIEVTTNDEVGYLAQSFQEMIHKRSGVENELRKTTHLLEKVFSSTHVLFAYVDREFNFLKVNKAYAEADGRQPECFIGKNHFEIYPNEENEALFREVVKTGKAYSTYAKPFNYPDQPERGTTYWDWSLQPCLDSQDSVEGLVFVLIDVTKRKQVEEGLSASRERWERTFNALEEVVTIHDTNMRTIQANRAAGRLFDAEPSALKGEHCYKLFRDNDEPCEGCPELLTRQDLLPHSAEIYHPKLDKTFTITSSPLKDEGGELTGFVHIAKDITLQKNMETQLQQAQKMEALGTLAAGIAHDFNNILTPILGYSEITREELPDDSPAFSYIDQIMDAGYRAKDLVTQILAFSRQTGHEGIPIQIHLIVKEATKLLRASIPTTIELRQNIDPECEIVMADPTQIHQIVMNLCTNAYQAMKETGGLLEIELLPVEINAEDVADKNLELTPGPYVKLEICDTGPGMNDSTVTKIFNPYFTTKKEGEGTGLGLSVVHTIIKSFGGEISVKSELGKGTTFSVYLPRIDSIAHQENRQESDSCPVGTEKILLVDDEKVIVEMSKKLLEKLGYQTIIFTNAKDALEAFTKAPDNFDVIITDMTMPDLTGIKLSQKIHDIRPDIPIILCTGYNELIDKEKALSLGVQEFLLKPVVFVDLAKAVRNVLDERKS